MLKALTILFLTFIFLQKSQAQILSPVGLYEGMMANSGAAARSSSAASYFNPSLLSQRTDNAFSLNGSTVGITSSKGNDTSMSSSLAIAPSYLSSIIVGKNLVHEFFLASPVSGNYNVQTTSGKNFIDMEMDVNQVVSGYSMAFKSIPLALQVLTRYSESKTNGFVEMSDPGANMYSTSKVKSAYKNLNLALGISTHFEFDHYTLGVNFNTRGWSLYNFKEGSAKTFLHGSPNPSDYTVIDNEASTQIVSEEGKLVIGHSFKIGHHELLTDSTFMEYSGSLNTYEFMQSFGYRYGAQDGDQFLCGLAHKISSDTNYAGQSFGTSAGYSWVTRKLRSGLGIYYSKDSSQSESYNVGFIFGSEYEY